MNFVIDFSWSMDQWMETIKNLFILIQDFFADLGIQLFEQTTSSESTNPENA